MNNKVAHYTTKRIDDDTIARIDIRTGEFRKIKIATKKQMDFIKSLQDQLEIPHKSYKNLTVWQASNIIEKLLTKKKESENGLQSKIV